MNRFGRDNRLRFVCFAAAILVALSSMVRMSNASEAPQSKSTQENAEPSDMSAPAGPQLYQLLMTLKPIPPEVAKEKGAAEDAYAKKLIEEGVIRSFFVSEDHKNYWITFSVESEEDLLKTLKAFPLHDYFDYEYIKVMSIVDMVKAGVKGPNP